VTSGIKFGSNAGTVIGSFFGPAGAAAGRVIGAGVGAGIGFGIGKFCSLSEEEKKRKNCQALKDSILNTCAGLTGRAQFKCFEAANTAFRQCMGFE
jgi:hypothetical protein